MRKGFVKLLWLTVAVCLVCLGGQLVDQQGQKYRMESLQQAISDAVDLQLANDYLQNHLPKFRTLVGEALDDIGILEDVETTFLQDTCESLYTTMGTYLFRSYFLDLLEKVENFFFWEKASSVFCPENVI